MLLNGLSEWATTNERHRKVLEHRLYSYPLILIHFQSSRFSFILSFSRSLSLFLFYSFSILSFSLPSLHRFQVGLRSGRSRWVWAFACNGGSTIWRCLAMDGAPFRLFVVSHHMEPLVPLVSGVGLWQVLDVGNQCWRPCRAMATESQTWNGNDQMTVFHMISTLATQRCMSHQCCMCFHFVYGYHVDVCFPQCLVFFFEKLPKIIHADMLITFGKSVTDHKRQRRGETSRNGRTLVPPHCGTVCTFSVARIWTTRHRWIWRYWKNVLEGNGLEIGEDEGRWRREGDRRDEENREKESKKEQSKTPWASRSALQPMNSCLNTSQYHEDRWG